MFGAILPVSERTVPSLPTPESNIFQAMWSNRRIRAVIIILNAIIVGLTVLHFAINIDTILGPTIPPNYSSSLDINTANLSDTKEVYAFYLSTPEMDQHYLRSALVLIYALKRDPKFQDPDRNVVVLVSSQTSTADILALQDAGAGIHPIPDYVDAIEDMDDVPRNFYLQAYTYSKTWLWAMACERVLYINANIVLNKPLRDVWIDAHAWPASGLSAIADTDKDGTGDTFGEGFMLLRPDKTIYKELRKLERMEDSSLDQNVLNKYFSRQGPKPWEPLNHIFTAMRPTRQDISDGAYTLHEKGWTMETTREVADIWWEWYGRMIGWQETLAEALDLDQGAASARRKAWPSWWTWR